MFPRGMKHCITHLLQYLEVREKTIQHELHGYPLSLRRRKRTQVVSPTGNIGSSTGPTDADRVNTDAVTRPSIFALRPHETRRNTVSGLPFGCFPLRKHNLVQHFETSEVSKVIHQVVSVAAFSIRQYRPTVALRALEARRKTNPGFPFGRDTLRYTRKKMSVFRRVNCKYTYIYIVCLPTLCSAYVIPSTCKLRHGPQNTTILAQSVHRLFRTWRSIGCWKKSAGRGTPSAGAISVAPLRGTSSCACVIAQFVFAKALPVLEVGDCTGFQ